jgi:hypothetical protein
MTVSFLCSDPFVSRPQEEGRCEEQHQRMCLMQHPRQLLTDAMAVRPDDDRHAPGQCPLRNIWLLRKGSRKSYFHWLDIYLEVGSTDTSMSKMETRYFVAQPFRRS